MEYKIKVVECRAGARCIETLAGFDTFCEGAKHSAA